MVGGNKKKSKSSCRESRESSKSQSDIKYSKSKKKGDIHLSPIGSFSLHPYEEELILDLIHNAEIDRQQSRQFTSVENEILSLETHSMGVTSEISHDTYLKLSDCNDSSSNDSSIHKRYHFTNDQRRHLLRRLVRDDRRVSKEEISTKETRRRNRNCISQTQSPLPLSGTSTVNRVAVTMRCEGKGGEKGVLLDTAQLLSNFITKVRNMFNVGISYNTLLLLPDMIEVTQESVMSSAIGNESTLLLCKNETSDQRRNWETITGDEVAMSTEILSCILEDSPPNTNGLALDDADLRDEMRIDRTKKVEDTENVDVSADISGVDVSAIDFHTDSSPHIVPDPSSSSSSPPNATATPIVFPFVRSELPIHKHRDHIVQTIQCPTNSVVLISGATGSGKSTQVPQFLLDSALTSLQTAATTTATTPVPLPLPTARTTPSLASIIVCTQPRRVAAVALAERVAVERGEECGRTVGYQIRLKSCCSIHTKILYCTTGVLLRKLQDPRFLLQVSHVVVDEVHERQVETDFLLCVLKRLHPSNPHLKLVLMSATLHEQIFLDYFGSRVNINNNSDGNGSCPVVLVEGRTFPVTVFHKEEVMDFIGSAQKEIGSYRQGETIQQYKSPSQSTSQFTSPLQSKSKAQGRGHGRGKGDILGGRNLQGRSHDSTLSLSSSTSPKKDDAPILDVELVAELIVRIIQKFDKNSRDTMGRISTAGARVTGRSSVKFHHNQISKDVIAVAEEGSGGGDTGSGPEEGITEAPGTPGRSTGD
eukprot:gene9936-20661_t